MARTNRHGHLAQAALLLVLGAAPAGAQFQDPDRIERHNGPSIKATVTYDGYDKVSYKKAGRQAKDLGADEVAAIVYGGYPDAFGQAKAAERQADAGGPEAASLYETAANSYELAANAQELREPLKAYSLYLGAFCRFKLGLLVKARLGEAAARYDAFLKAFPKHRLALEGSITLGRIRRLAGEHDAAIEGLKALEKMVLDATLPRIWEARAKAEEIRTLLAAGRAKDASPLVTSLARVLDEINPRTPAVEAIALTGRLLEGRVLILNKDFTGAVRFFEKVHGEAAAAANPGAMAAAMVGLGEAYLAQGTEAQNLRRAQLCFAQAYALDQADGDLSARALFGLGETLLALGPEKGGKEAAAMAKDYFKQVVLFHPLSDWAPEARKRQD